MLGWCAATLTSIALASVAMLPVLRTATPDDGALVSVDQLRDAGAAEPIAAAGGPPPRPRRSGPHHRAGAAPHRRPRPTPSTHPATPSRTAGPPAAATGDHDRGRLDGDHGR